MKQRAGLTVPQLYRGIGRGGRDESSVLAEHHVDGYAAMWQLRDQITSIDIPQSALPIV